MKTTLPIEEIINDRLNGMTARQIALKYGVSKETIRLHLKKHNLNERSEAFTPEQVNALIECRYEHNTPVTVIADLFDVDYRMCRKFFSSIQNNSGSFSLSDDQRKAIAKYTEKRKNHAKHLIKLRYQDGLNCTQIARKENRSAGGLRHFYSHLQRRVKAGVKASLLGVTQEEYKLVQNYLCNPSKRVSGTSALRAGSSVSVSA